MSSDGSSQQVPGSIDMSNGPPYLPMGAAPGGIPNKSTDVPIAVVLVVLILACFVSANLINRQNRYNGTPFNFIFLFFVWSILRTAGLAMRIATASVTGNPNLTIAANVFANAGGILLMIFNMLVMPILMRAYFGFEKSAAGWRKKISTLPFFIPIPLVPIMLLMTINVVILSFFTTDVQTRANTVTGQKVALVTLTCVSFIPFLPALFVAATSGSRPTFPAAPAQAGGSIVDRILRPVPGFGKIRSLALLMMFSSGIMTLNTAIRASTLFLPRRPMEDPAWYHSRATYYIFTFALEIVIVIVFLLNRVDRRFQAPKGPDAEKEEQVKSANDLEAGQRGDDSSQRPASRDDTLAGQYLEGEESSGQKGDRV